MDISFKKVKYDVIENTLLIKLPESFKFTNKYDPRSLYQILVSEYNEKHVSIDFSDIKNLTSMDLVKLIELNTECKNRKRTLSLVGMNASIIKIIEATGLKDILNISGEQEIFIP